MKRVLNVTFGTLIAAGILSPVNAHTNDFLRHSAISGTLTYTETSNNGLSVGDYTFGHGSRIENQVFFPALIGRRSIFLDIQSDFDYALGYTYRIPGTPTRFFISYDHYHTTDNVDAVGVTTDIGMRTTDGEAFLALFDGRNEIEGYVNQRENEFKIGFSHLLNFGMHFDLDLSTFLEWDSISRNLYEEAIGFFLSGGSPIFTEIGRNTDSKMEGWGIGVGARAHGKPFRSNLHWGVFLGINTALIWADNEFSQFLEPGIVGIGYSLDPESSDSIVPKVDVSLGIDYCRIFHSDLGSMLFEATLGMRYLNFINALKNGNTAYNPFWDGDEDSAVNTGFANDWGRVGPFFTIRIGGAEA